MKTIKTRFEAAPGSKHIEVTVRAAKRDAEVEALLTRIHTLPPDDLTAADKDGALCKVPVRDVICVTVTGKQARLVTEGGSYTLRQPLQSLEQELTERNFVRISRYEMVNLDKVIKYDFTLSGTLRLELACGMETWASRRCIPSIRRRLTGKEGDGC